MLYDVIILPNLRTIRSTTFDIAVHGFLEIGGDVIIAGEIPSFMDAKPPTSALAAASFQDNIIPWDQGLILAYLGAVQGYPVLPEA